MKILITVLACFFCLISTTSTACTTWASVGSVNQLGGLLLVKNRDAPHKGHEKLILFHPKNHIPYLALAYNSNGSNQYPYYSAGVNQKGLAVVNNAADVYPVQYDREQGETSSMKAILKNYTSVAEVLQHAKQLFSTSKVNFLIIGDPKQIVTVEIGPKKQYCIYGKTNNGFVYHTNQYQCKNLETFNHKKFPDSITRYHTIQKLLTTHTGKYTFNDYYTFSNRQNYGLNSSIFRKWTAATWVLQYPSKGNPLLYVRFTSPAQQYHVYRIQLTPAFWKHRTFSVVPSE